MRLFTDKPARHTAFQTWLAGPAPRQPLSWLLLSLALLLSPLLWGQEATPLFPDKPDPVVHVHDYAGWLSGAEMAQLEAKLRRYSDSTSTQIVVMIRPDIGDYDKSSYAFELGNRWGIGRKDKNNGIVMLIKSEPPDRGIFIATGYGTEGALPDITAGQIIRNTMGPFFRQQRYFDGINAGLDDVIRALSGEFKSDAKDKVKIRGNGTFVLIMVVIFIILFVYLMIQSARRRTLYSNSGPNRRRRDDDWWGGGFGGFGGGFGGGSSGGWGGGGGGDSFGGGSFGGGGAGGDW
ncbi:MAG: TPM domain-containing protein [Saprospiraceae bacterium]|nr:TPM domain-containing protein [Saprospiraceae bacterium]